MKKQKKHEILRAEFIDCLDEIMVRIDGIGGNLENTSPRQMNHVLRHLFGQVREARTALKENKNPAEAFKLELPF